VLEPVAAEELEQLLLPLRPDPEPAEHTTLIVFDGDADPPPQSCCRGIVAEHGEAERVQGPAGDLLRRGADLAPEPRRDLVGGLVGERDSADAGR
jgi:hypothetical protein